MKIMPFWKTKGIFQKLFVLMIYVSSVLTYDYTSSGSDWTGTCSTGQL